MDYNLVSGGTDTHLVLIDLSDKNISGKKAELILEKGGITTNKNMVPFDKRSPLITSGIRQFLLSGFLTNRHPCRSKT